MAAKKSTAKKSPAKTPGRHKSTAGKRTAKKTPAKAARPTTQSSGSKPPGSTQPGIGKVAPAFSLPAAMPGSPESEQRLTLGSLRGSQVVVYFYPRDNTPGCSTESADFNRLLPRFEKISTRILGISCDNLKSHHRFIDKLSLKFPLLSDEDGSVCRKYAVFKLKKMYGREFEGIERSTFLIDSRGRLQQIWRKVKVPGHAEAVLAEARRLHGESKP